MMLTDHHAIADVRARQIAQDVTAESFANLSPMKLVARTDPILWTPAEAVLDIKDGVLPHLEEMRSLMAEFGGMGLAAPQVGIGLRFFITNARERNLRCVINPRLEQVSTECTSDREGCLSWERGTMRDFVKRHDWIVASWTNIDGAPIERQRLGGVLARLFQHERDHLDGINIFSNAA